MRFRSAITIATLLIGLGDLGCQAFAQYYPYVYPGPPYGPRPPIDADDDPRETATLPPEVRLETGPKKELPPQFHRTVSDYDTKEPAGTIIVDTPSRTRQWQGAALWHWRRSGGLHLVRRGTYFKNGGVARLESAGNNDRAAALFAALHGRWRRQPARGARPLPWSDSLPHSRHQSAVDHWNLRVLGLYPAHQ